MKRTKNYIVFIIAFLVSLLLPVVSYFMFRSSTVQTFCTQKIASILADKLNTKISIDGIDLSFKDGLVLEKLYAEDLQKDTLLYVDEISADLKELAINKKKIIVDHLKLKNLVFNLNEDSTETLNLMFIIDAFASTNTSEIDTIKQAPWYIKCERLELTNSAFSLQEYQPDSIDYGMNYSDLDITDINLKIEDIILGDTIWFNFRHLSAKDKSGFVVNDIRSDNYLCGTEINLSNLTIETPNSNLLAKHLKFKYKKLGDFPEFISKVKLDVSFIDSSIFSTQDLAYFAPAINGFDKEFGISGGIKGKVSNLRGKKIRINFADTTYLYANFDIDGLPNISETFIFFDVKEFITNKSDIEQIKIPPYAKSDYLKLPDIFRQFGEIKYKGNFTGLIDDFVSYGKFTTKTGNISTDISIKTDTTSGKTQIKGKLETHKFNLGKVLEATDYLGKITMDAKVDGTISRNGDLQVNLTSNISSIEVNKYELIDIEVIGDLANDKFDGSVVMVDPALKMGFLGKVDFSKEIPAFNFAVSLYQANLFKLNLLSDSLSSLSAFINADFVGTEIDDIKGQVDIGEIKFQQTTGTIRSNNINLLVNKKNTANKNISFTSDFADINMSGQYKYADLLNSVMIIANKYLPSFIDSSKFIENKDPSNFKFDITLKETEQITNAFIPKLKIKSGTKISGNFNSTNSDVTIKAYSPNIMYGENKIDKLTFEAKTNTNLFNIDLKSEIALLSDSTLDNISAKISINKDSVTTNIAWKNRDTISDFFGNLSLFATFDEIPDAVMPKINVKMNKSEITLADAKIDINPCEITINGTSINIKDFKIYQGDQALSINGIVSENKQNILTIDVRNINLEDFNIITERHGALLNGTFNGTTELIDLYDNPRVFTNDSITNFELNNSNLGNIYINSNWDNKDEKMHMAVYTKKGETKTIDVSGDFYKKTKKLDFNVVLKKFKLNIIEPFVKDFISDINARSVLAGKLKINGNLDEPKITGKMIFRSTKFTVNYLQTRYSITDSILLTEDAIEFNDFLINADKTKKDKLIDRKKRQKTDNIEATNRVLTNTALLNGKISHNFFKDIFIDLNLDARKFLLLKTNPKDNDFFYGTAYATGIINIFGSPSDLIVDINVKTEKGTKFFVPVSFDSEVSESNNFITFINKDTIKSKKEDLYIADISGIKLNFSLEATPEAEVQIILDEKVGDIIKARGSGVIRMKINTLGDFNMYGNYTISEGNYLFTLKNLINKKLQVASGGAIKWNGDPFNASIDMQAVYSLRKVSLHDLMPEDKNKDIRFPVECQLNLENKLMNPDITFDIGLPGFDTEDNIKSRIKNLADDEKNKQILSLLIINRFQPLPGFSSSVENVDVGAAGAASAYEMLSNQLTHWLSQISKDFDIGVNYRPGDELSNDELEVALSTQLFNDRVTINVNSNLGIGGADETTQTNDPTAQSGNQNAIVGDFDIDYKITKNGKLRTKYSAKTKEKTITDDAPYSQSIGIFYKEDFNSFKELFKKYKLKLKRTKD